MDIQWGNGILFIGKDNVRTIQFLYFGNVIKALESITMFAFPGGKNLGYFFAFEGHRSEFMALVKQQKVVENVNRDANTSTFAPQNPTSPISPNNK